MYSIIRTTDYGVQLHVQGRTQTISDLCCHNKDCSNLNFVFVRLKLNMLELKKNSVVMASAIFLPNTGGWVNGFITRRNIEGFYNNLNLPSWRPPNWLFGPVWTSLYCSMGYASYLVWKEGGGVNSRTYLPLTLYASQLALNWAWSPVFFQMHKLKASVYVIGALTTTATLTAITFGRISPLAGLLFVPYLAWLSFATYLNYTIYKDNRIEDITEEKKEEMKID